MPRLWLEYHIIFVADAWDTNRNNTPRRYQHYICKTLDVAADVLTARFLRNGDRKILTRQIMPLIAFQSLRTAYIRHVHTK